MTFRGSSLPYTSILAWLYYILFRFILILCVYVWVCACEHPWIEPLELL